MIDFIKLNYREIIVLFVFVFEFLSSLVLLFKKSKKEPSTYSILLQELPKFIKLAESKFGAGNGPEKKSFVLDQIKVVMALYGLEGDKILLKSISKQIEEILSTPSKKGNL